MSKSMRISVEAEVHAVTCPGVWFPCKSPVHLSICFLGFHIKTKPFPATFPLLFGDKFVLEKTFPGCSTLHDLQATLENQSLYVELLQEISPGHAVVLATFETSAIEFLFPFPQLRPTYTSGVDVDLLMEPTRDFPGIISPKIEASTRTHINETRHAHLDQLHDSAVTLNQVPPMNKHPHLSHSRSSSCGPIEHPEPFVWRKVEDDLIARKPSAHHVDMSNHVYHQPETGQSPSMRRSKSFGLDNEHRSRSRSRKRPPGPIRHPSGHISPPSRPQSAHINHHSHPNPHPHHSEFNAHHHSGWNPNRISPSPPGNPPPPPSLASHHPPPPPMQGHAPPPPPVMQGHHPPPHPPPVMPPHPPPSPGHRPLPPLPTSPHTHSPHYPPVPHHGMCRTPSQSDLHGGCPVVPVPAHHHNHGFGHSHPSPCCGSSGSFCHCHQCAAPQHPHEHLCSPPVNRCASMASCHNPIPLCTDPLTCPYSCHVDGHPPFPHPPSSTPHIHSKHSIHHGPVQCFGPCCS